jgi:NAD(P)-dependent dehydrogenase (short-subunit alcohol dehydrogenase family)
MGRFEGKNVIVTGGAQGIGRAIVEAFLDEGARVFVADIRAEGLDRVGAGAPGVVETYVVDLADFDAAQAMVRKAIDRLGRIHVLVNCAGSMPDGRFLETTQELFDHTFAVNARAPMATMQVAAAHMIEHGAGVIVNVASANAFKNESPESVYNASKAALVALTKAAAHELGHLGIRANCVAPGQTVTPETEAEMRTNPEEQRIQHEYLRKIPLRRAGAAKEQAAAVLFLASDEASFVSAETLVVDGGEIGGGDWYDRSIEPPVPGAPPEVALAGD